MTPPSPEPAASPGQLAPPAESDTGRRGWGRTSAPADPALADDWFRRNDPRGYWVYVFFAAGFLFFRGTPVTAAEIAGAPMAVWWFACVRWTWPMLNRFGAYLTARLILAWIAWVMLSLLWTPSNYQGWREVGGTARFVVAVPLLWPVLNQRRVLIAALAAGFFLMNAVQAAQWAGFIRHPHWMVWASDPDRISAWTQPVVAGSLLTAALGLHLPAALMARGWPRTLGIAGSAISAAAAAATGTRGAWLASIALFAAVALTAAVRYIRSGSRRRLAAIPITVALAAAIALAVWLVSGPAIQRRVDKGLSEVREALRSDNYQSDTGKRIDMARQAVAAFQSHPIRGVGAGGYQQWALDNLKSQGVDITTRDIRRHAHSTPLHLAATLGIVGLLLFSALTLYPLITECRRLHHTPGPLGYDAGPAFALLGLLLAGVFDTIYVNSQTAALLFALVGLCVPRRPKQPVAAAPDPGTAP